MNIGYYTHPSAYFLPDGTALVEAQYGILIRSLAAEAGQVTVFAHATKDKGNRTMVLGPDVNVRMVNIGPARARPIMYTRTKPNLEHFDAASADLDVMLVRGPTPLLPAFARRATRLGIPMVGLIIGNFDNWRPTADQPAWRNQLIRGWLWWMGRAHARVGRTRLMLAISQSIVSDPNFKRTAIFPSTTLVKADLTGPAARTRAWPPSGERIRLLFTGRLVQEKGLFELGEAVAQLVAAGYNVEAEIVGPTHGDKTIERVKKIAAGAGVADRLLTPGYLEAGPALLAAYQRADLYVLPTHVDGSVPRSIKEAFATGLPVVTTSIEQIAEFLTDGEQAVLVEPHSAEALAAGIIRMIDDEALRRRVSGVAFAWVQDYTSEASAALIVNHLRDEIALTAK